MLSFNFCGLLRAYHKRQTAATLVKLCNSQSAVVTEFWNDCDDIYAEDEAITHREEADVYVSWLELWLRMKDDAKEDPYAVATVHFLDTENAILYQQNLPQESADGQDSYDKWLDFAKQCYCELSKADCKEDIDADYKVLVAHTYLTKFELEKLKKDNSVKCP